MIAACVQEMQDIFGDVEDLLEVYAEKRAAALLSKDGGDEEGLDPAEEDPDIIATFEERQARP